ncbi:putative ribonuclease H-like domain-containing protein, partial [Tanacetum coccineum]
MVLVSQTLEENGITLQRCLSPVTVEERQRKRMMSQARGLLLVPALEIGVSDVSPSVNTASPQVCTASVSDNTMYAFMVENPNGSNVLHQDLEQIHEDDLEARIKGVTTVISLGSLARSSRAPRSKEGQFRNQDNTRKQGNNEDTSKAMLAIDGVGFDWSDMAEEQVQTNMALMAFLDSEVYTDKTYSKTCLKNYETLKKQYDDLVAKQHQTEFKAITYKRGLDTVDAQLVTYRKNEVLLVKSDVQPDFKGYGPKNSKKEFNIVKESDNSKENSDKSLVKELESQVKSSFVKDCGCNTSKKVSEVEPKKVRENNDAPIIEDWVSDDEEQDESITKPEKKTITPTAAKIEKPVRKSVRVDNYYYAKTSHYRTHKNVTPRAVLLRTGLKPLSTAKPVYTAHPKPTVHCARPKTHFFKSAQSTVQRPFYKKPALTNRHFNHKVNTVRHRIVNTARSYRTPVNTVRPRVINTARQNRTSVNAARANGFNAGKPQHDDKGFVDSGCSRHMTGNIAYLSDFKQFDGGYVAFGGGAYGGKISGKGTLKTANLDFEDVYFVNELKFNLFSVSQMCDKKNYVLFTDTECLVLSPNFKLPDENQILLKVPRKDNMYSFDMKNIVPKESLTCLVAKATLDESMLWHRRLGKQHRASCKSKVLNPITKPLFMLHMDFFGPTFDETSEILKGFIKEIENLVDKKVKIIRSDNETEFKKKVMDDFCREKGAFSTACYVQNRVLVVKPHNKTPYELFRGFKPALSFMRPFGCHVTILNTLDSLGKFDGKTDEENKPMIEGICPKWLFDIDSLTQSMNYVSVSAGTVSNISAENVENGEPKTANDTQKQDEDGLNMRMLNKKVSTASPNEEDNTKEEPEVDLGNITN